MRATGHWERGEPPAEGARAAPGSQLQAMRGADLGRLSTLPSDAEPPPHICQRETWAPVREEVVSLESPEVPTMRTDTQAAPPMDRHAAATENGVEPPVQTAGPRDTLVDGKKQMQE